MMEDSCASLEQTAKESEDSCSLPPHRTFAQRSGSACSAETSQFPSSRTVEGLLAVEAANSAKFVLPFPSSWMTVRSKRRDCDESCSAVNEPWQTSSALTPRSGTTALTGESWTMNLGEACVSTRQRSHTSLSTN